MPKVLTDKLGSHWNYLTETHTSQFN